MTHQAPPSTPASGADPGRRIAQLREALDLVRAIGGAAADSATDSQLNAAARISAAYDAALPVVQRRFDALAEETSAWAAAGVEALLAAGADRPARAAAARLAAEMEKALGRLGALLN